MKKVVVLILSAFLAVFAGAVFAMVYYKLSNSGTARADGLIPVERISGIHAKAKLKPGSIVSEGYHFPFDDNGVWCHCGRVSGVLAELGGETDNKGLPVSEISIIDVYGDRCTITFICTDDKERYACYDYPLANLKYDQAKVDAANDGIKVSFNGSRFTLGK